MLEFLNNLWELEPSRNRVVVPARQASQADGVDSLESILVLLKGKKIRSLKKMSVAGSYLTFLLKSIYKHIWLKDNWVPIHFM